MTKLPPLPVDLNELPDREREEIPPGPIGVVSRFAPKKFRIESEMAKVVADINAASGLPRATTLPPNIEHITTELSSLLTASAETMVTEANNLLAETRAWADNLREEVARKIAEHAALTERLQEFGKKVLEAHNQYHNPKED